MTAPKDFNDRMLSLGLARVSEAAAHASALLIGRGDEKAADAAAVELLLKAADTAKGFDRTKQTGTCLLLAENLLVLGRKKEATRIYKHLRDTRKDPAEAYIREAAEQGLKQVG